MLLISDYQSLQSISVPCTQSLGLFGPPKKCEWSQKSENKDPEI